MKKFIMLFVFMVLLLPISAKAYHADPKKTDCVKVDENCTGGECESVCTVKIYKGAEDELGLFEIKAAFSVGDGVTITAVTPSDKFNYTGTASNAKFTAVDTENGVSDSEFVLATITTKYAQGIDCTLRIQMEGKTIEIPVDNPGNPHTGVSLPLAILLGAAGLAIVTSTITNKNKKIYNI